MSSLPPGFSDPSHTHAGPQGPLLVPVCGRRMPPPGLLCSQVSPKTRRQPRDGWSQGAEHLPVLICLGSSSLLSTCCVDAKGEARPELWEHIPGAPSTHPGTLLCLVRTHPQAPGTGNTAGSEGVRAETGFRSRFHSFLPVRLHPASSGPP